MRETYLIKTNSKLLVEFAKTEKKEELDFAWRHLKTMYIGCCLIIPITIIFGILLAGV